MYSTCKFFIYIFVELCLFVIKSYFHRLTIEIDFSKNGHYKCHNYYINTLFNRSKSESLESSLTSDQLIQGSLLSDLKAGRLGDMPKVVIVHPDGTVEEVTSKLHTLAQEKSLEEVIVANKLEDIAQEKSMEEVMMHIVDEETQVIETATRLGIGLYLVKDVEDPKFIL